jgi:hypothetical protein
MDQTLFDFQGLTLNSDLTRLIDSFEGDRAIDEGEDACASVASDEIQFAFVPKK